MLRKIVILCLCMIVTISTVGCSSTDFEEIKEWTGIDLSGVASQFQGLVASEPEESYSYLWLIAQNDIKADHLKITLDISTGYEIIEDYPLEKGKDPMMSGDPDFYVWEDRVGIFKDGELVSEIFPADVSTWNKDKVIKAGKEIETGNQGMNEYVFWSNNGVGYHHVVIIPGSDTAFVIRNMISEESARECFSLLTFWKIG